ncbi:MAG: glycosyltransferase family 4 protein, partial [Methanobacteriota archaeon]
LPNILGKNKGTPVVQEIHYADLHPYTIKDIHSYPKKASGMLWAAHLRLARKAAKTADVVVTPSKYMKNRLVEVFGLPEENISVVPVGVNEDVFSIKRNTGGGETTNIIFVGRLVKEKGLDVLINALTKVGEKKDARLTVVGDGPLKEQYVKQARQLGISEKTNFKGFLTRENILSLLSETDMLVVPSLAENFPRITLEGMGAGVPVIASCVGGIPEQITDGVNGMLFSPGDHNELADKIIKLSSDPDTTEKMGSSGRESAREFTIQKKITCFERLYGKLLA